jgi:hypothetical protein
MDDHGFLSGNCIDLQEQGGEHWGFYCTNLFVKESRDNETVQKITLCPDNSWTHSYAVWNKIAEGIGNLQALREITMSDDSFAADEEDDEDYPLAPDWEILACILRRLRRGIQLCMCDNGHLLWDTECLPAFAEAIHGHAMITGFRTGNGFPCHCLDILCSALLTLPALINVSFEHYDGEGPEEGQSLESCGIDERLAHTY